MQRTSTSIALTIAALAVSSAVNAKTLVYCSEGSPENFNPQLYTSGTSVDASAVPIYNRLVDFKVGTTELQPSLAESWEVSEDGKVYTFHLRKGVKFQSNKYFKPTRDFNADDVIFSFMRQKDPNNPYHNVSNGNYSNFESLEFGSLITAIDKPDEYTVRFTLAHPEAPFVADLGWYFASILSAEYADAMLKKGTPEYVDSWPIGTGPYALQQYKVDSQIRYIANPHYWEGEVPTKHLIFSITPNVETRLAKLQTNECQIIPAPSPVQFPVIKGNKDLALHAVEALNVGYLAFNTEKKPFDNVLVRQALNYATDKQAIVKAVFLDSGNVAKSPIPANMLGYKKDLPDYDYNPQKAKELLKQAGLEQGAEVTLWSMPVQRPYNPNSKRVAEMIQNDWSKVGIKAKIVSYEWGEYLKRVKDGEHQAALMGWTTATGDPDNFFGPLFTCQSANGGSNSAKWCYAPFDKIIAEAKTITDRPQREALYKQAQQMMHDQMPAVMIAHSTIFEPVNKSVIGYEIDPFGKHIFYQVDVK